MIYHLRTCREFLHLTIEEMASELGISKSYYAMMDRGKRKVPASLRPAMADLAAKYNYVPFTARPVPAEDSPLMEELKKLAKNTFQKDLVYDLNECMIKLYQHEKKLKRMRKQFEAAQKNLKQAESELPGLKNNPACEQAYIILIGKRNKNRLILERIIKSNPVKLQLEIQSLRQHKVLIENAMAANADKLVSFGEEQLWLPEGKEM